jgi:cytochrome c oxidase cbb3-type subunit 4
MERWAYEDVLAFVQSWDAIYFGLMFVVAFAYAFWPRNQAKFREAARIPLQDENP